jgi:hypothetical protein
LTLVFSVQSLSFLSTSPAFELVSAQYWVTQ